MAKTEKKCTNPRKHKFPSEFESVKKKIKSQPFQLTFAGSSQEIDDVLLGF